MSDLNKRLEVSAKLLAILATAVYATGFLVVSAFLDRFGVGDPGAEFLKVKYVQVGLLYMLFPCGILAPIFTFFYLRDHPGTLVKMPTFAILNISNLFLVCYWFATFANPGDFYVHRKGIAFLFAWTVFGITAGRRLGRGESSDNQWVDAIAGMTIDRIWEKHPRLQKHRRDIVRMIIAVPLLIVDIKVIGTPAKVAWLLVAAVFAVIWTWRLGGSWKIGPRDLLEAPRFAIRLACHADTVSKFLWESFSEAARRTIASATDPAQLTRALVGELNRIMRRDSIYEETRFAGVSLSEETKRLALQKPAGAKRLRLNRLLLECACPEITSISKSPHMRNRLLLAMASGATVSVGLYLTIRRLPIDWPSIERVPFYYLFCFLAALSLWHERKRIVSRYHRDVQPAAWFFEGAIICGLYYMGILAFAHGVYPQIPFMRGGGNYVGTPDTELYWKSDVLQSVPTNILSWCSVGSSNPVSSSASSNLIKSVRLKIIEQTPSMVFVADPADPAPDLNTLGSKGGVEAWSLWKTPRVVALKRDSIMAMVNLETKGTNLTQPTPSPAPLKGQAVARPADSHKLGKP